MKSLLCFVLQLLGAAFLAIGLWAWAEKVSINTCMPIDTNGVQCDCNSIAELFLLSAWNKTEVYLAEITLDETQILRVVMW